MLPRKNIAAILIALIANINNTPAFQLSARSINRHEQQLTLSSFSRRAPTTRLSSAVFSTKASVGEEEGTNSGSFWRARQDCWRPDVSDVERISWGMPAKKKGTGSRGMPHRLNEDERRSFDQARRKGFLEVYGSAWRSQRRDAPLLNSYRSLMDARGRPMVVLHKISPNSAAGENALDRIVVDLSPLRLPGEFHAVEKELREKVMKEMNLEGQLIMEEEDDFVHDGEQEEDADDNVDDKNLDMGTADESWENRPIYQLPPYSISWEVSRQEGKQLGKFLGEIFEIPEMKAQASKKPKGVKPGKGRRHGGYGIG